MSDVDLTPAELNLLIHQGDDYPDLLTIVPKDDNGDPVDLTGCSAACDLARYGVVTSMTVVVTDDIVAGMDAAQTSALDPSTYTYDLQLVASGGAILTLLKGSITVEAEVTA